MIYLVSKALSSWGFSKLFPIDPPVFGFENPDALVFPENAGTVQVCVVVVSGTVSQTTAVTVSSGQLGDSATGTLTHQQKDSFIVEQTLLFCRECGLCWSDGVFGVHCWRPHQNVCGSADN